MCEAERVIHKPLQQCTTEFNSAHSISHPLPHTHTHTHAHTHTRTHTHTHTTPQKNSNLSLHGNVNSSQYIVTFKNSSPPTLTLATATILYEPVTKGRTKIKIKNKKGTIHSTFQQEQIITLIFFFLNK